jgi:glycosyltransferase involved in cell wall biosynthesis
MKVLWFSNTPSGAANRLSSASVETGGWIESLEQHLTKNPDIELAVAFHWTNETLDSLTIGKTKYYKVPKNEPKGKLRCWVSRIRHQIEPQNLIKYYLMIIEDFGPDIIHIFGTEGPFGLIVPNVKIPVVIHFQGNITVYNHKWFSGIDRFDLLRYSNVASLLKGRGLFHDYFRYKKVVEREREIFSGCKHFMGRTEWDRRIVSVLSPNAAYYHSDEILREQFYRTKWQKDRDKKTVLLSTISINIYKGLETIYETMSLLLKEFPQFDLEWKVAGISRDDEISKILSRKHKKGFSEKRIALLGRKDARGLLGEMCNADIFIHPSHIDNSPNALCEAMTIGMPIIATYAGGIPSLLVNGHEGILVQDGDPYAMAGAIMELLKDKEFATALGQNARLRALERHNPEKIVSDVIKIYEDVLKSCKFGNARS